MLLFFLLAITAGCSSSEWLVKPNELEYRTLSVMYASTELIDETGVFSDSVKTLLSTTLVDSASEGALKKLVWAYRTTKTAGLTALKNDPNADIVFTVDRISIKKVPTLDVTHPGMNLKLTFQITAKQAGKEVYQQSLSLHRNMAYVAGGDKKFHKIKEEEILNPDYQIRTVEPALTTASGKAFSSFLRL